MPDTDVISGVVLVTSRERHDGRGCTVSTEQRTHAAAIECILLWSLFRCFTLFFTFFDLKGQ